MDRAMRQESGFTLVELMIALAVVVILVSVAFTRFDRLDSVNSINEDMHKISNFIHAQKMAAFTQKQNIYLIVAGTQITTVIDPSGDDTAGPVDGPSGDDIAGVTLVLNNTIRSSVSPFSIDPRGNISTGNISINALNTGAQFSCVKIDNVRTRLGEWNGTCNEI